MKKPLYVVMLVIFAMFMTSAQAAPVVISFVSGDMSATSSTGNTYLITPHPVWDTISGASWVSAYAGTGYGGGVVLPNSTGLANPTMTFTQSFLLPYAINSGSLTVGADDTMAVWLNDKLLKQANWVQDGACADGPIACEQGEFLTLTLSPYLVQGANTLTMDVYQRGLDVTGAVWSGTASSVPEPATFATMSGALVGLALLVRRRRQQRE